MLGGPWTLGLIWSIVTPSGRRHVWRRPTWRLFGLLLLSQLALVQQGWILGDRALQPFHFNRGYLHLGLVAIAWRAATVVVRSRRVNVETTARTLTRLPRWMVLIVVLTFGDQAFFALRIVAHKPPDGMVDRQYAELVSLLPDTPAPSLVLVDDPGLKPSYVTAFSPHIAYHAPETMVVPFPAKREVLLDEALKGEGGGVAGLGIRYAIGAIHGETIAAMREQGIICRMRGRSGL